MNPDEKAAKLEKHLLKTQFPLECEDIPLDSLTQEEQLVVIKCKNHADLTDDEFVLLKKTLQRYREAINTYKPSETIEAVETTKNLILTEKEFLDIIDNTSRVLKVNVPFDGNWYQMEFEILPLDDSRVVTALQTHVDLFKDYSKDEMLLFTKAQQGQVLTPEETSIVQKINKEVEEKSNEDRIHTINNFLAAQLRLPESSEDIEVRKEFWKKFPFLTKSAIMIKVEDRLGLTDQKMEKLFPTD